MATSATGTPTPRFALPTLDVTLDPPDGTGINNITQAVDTALYNVQQAAITKPTGIVSGEVPVWNGSAWVRSSALQIGPSSLGTGTADSTKFLRGDGTWATAGYPAVGKITVSAFSGGPPGSPSDGDIWIATGVDGTNGTRWQFQYSASSGNTEKWEFIGGPPVVRAGTSALTYSGGGSAQAYNGFTAWTAGRNGLYSVWGSIVGGDPALGGSHQLSAYPGIVLSAFGTQGFFFSQSGVTDYEQLAFGGVGAATAGNAFNILVQCGVNSVVFQNGLLNVLPVRVA